MAKGKGIIPKRTYRSEVIFDFDDMLILHFLSQADALLLDDLKKKVNMSHKGLLVHFKRLLFYGCIFINRAPGKLNKIVEITPYGKKIYQDLLMSDYIRNRAQEYFIGQELKEHEKK